MRGRERRGIFRDEPEAVKEPKAPKAKAEPKPKAETKPKEVKPKTEKKTETPQPNKADGVAGYMEAKGNEGENLENLTV